MSVFIIIIIIVISLFCYLDELFAVLQLQEQYCDNITEKNADVRLFGLIFAVKL